MTTVMAVCWRHSTILNSYSPQMEQREPEKRMLICLENAIYLLNVAPSNPLPHPLSPPPISLQFKDFIQQSRILHALYRKKMPPNSRIAKRTTAISIWALLPYPLAMFLWGFLSPDSSPYMALQWFKCDDAWITKATAEEVLASEG